MLTRSSLLLSPLLLLLFLCNQGTRAFTTNLQLLPSQCRGVTELYAAKGFGNAPPPEKKKVAKVPPVTDVSSSSTSSTFGDKTMSALETQQQQQAPSTLTAGQRALEEMRRQRAEQKDAELRKVQQLIQTDQQLQEAPAAIPEKVAQRMGARMIPFVGLPLFLGMGSFVGFWYMATYRDIEYEPSLVAASTIGILVLGLLVSDFFKVVVGSMEAAGGCDKSAYSHSITWSCRPLLRRALRTVL